MRIKIRYLAVAICATLFGSCKNDLTRPSYNLSPPIAQKIPKIFTEHGQLRTDNYFWLNDPQNDAVIKYLNAENEYVTKSLAHTEALQQKLYDEIIARIDPQSNSVPIKKKGYWYYARNEKGKEYPLQCRKKGNLNAPEEIFLNVPDMAKNYKVFRLFNWAFSHDNQWLAYSVDTSGNRHNSLFIKDLRTGKMLNEIGEKVATTDLVWGKDNKTLFYVVNDETVRAYKVMRHILGQSIQQDISVFEEKDNTFSVSLNLSQSGRFIFIHSQSTATSECLVIDAQNLGTPQVIQPRQRGVLYEVKHFDSENQFHILTSLLIHKK